MSAGRFFRIPASPLHHVTRPSVFGAEPRQVLERGERIELLVHKTDALQVSYELVQLQKCSYTDPLHRFPSQENLFVI